MDNFVSTTPVILLDNNVVRHPSLALQPQTAANGNRYYAASPKASKFGVQVAPQALPNGIFTVVEIRCSNADGTHTDYVVPMDFGTDFETKAPTATKRVGTARVIVDGKEMMARVTINTITAGYNIKVTVTNVGSGGSSQSAVTSLF